MGPAGSTVPENGSSPRIISIWVAPLAVLVGIWLWLAFSSGGYQAHQWLPPSLALGLFGLVVALAIAYPRRPRQLSLALLAAFGAYALWVAFSALWADSTSRVWMESGRTFGYLLLLALALTFFTDHSARRFFRYLLMAGIFTLLAVCLTRLWSTGNIAGLFFQNRLSYPVSYPNNAAALFLVAFWPLMWLAASPRERAPVRGVALGLATGLLGIAIMTQSRGAIWSLAITLVLMFVLSPARLRMLFYLVVPALLVVYEFPNLNRYWLEGPEAIGGGLAGRTILVASIIAAFIGMILTLLERWIRVSTRMKTIFGAIVLLGAAAAIVYGSISLTSEVGGPFKWVSQTWRQFTGESNAGSGEESASRFVMVSSSGRVNIWEVAWQGFTDSPTLGVGADNFVFQYDRLRETENYKPQQAHSFELQVLGETGFVGGIFAFGGILLSFGGVLWPRCTAGWRGARRTWLRRGRRAPDTEGRKPNPRWCNPRWGSEPAAYGWEIALVVGAAYWLIHASVDWLWQMAGVTIPALLFVAAAIASIDARAGLLWPRLNRWLAVGRITRQSQPRLDSEIDDATASAASDSEPEPNPKPETSDASLLLIARRSDQHAGKIRRRRRRAARKERAADLLQPPGLLSHGFRALLVTLSLVVTIAAGLPYLSIQYQNSALALAKSDGVRAAQRAESAKWFLLSAPGPYLTQASIYTSAAQMALVSQSPDRAGAVIDDLSLSIDSYTKAIACEPADWTIRFRAGVASLNLLLAQAHATGVQPVLDYSKLIPAVPGLRDWSGLTDPDLDPTEAGQAAVSLAVTERSQRIAQSYRDLEPAEIATIALQFFSQARERNPLAVEIATAIRTTEELLAAH